MERISSENFDSIINQLDSPYLLKFGSKTCGPCNTMGPVLEKLSEENPDFKVYEVDTDESPELAGSFEIKSIPAMHFCDGREIIYSLQGVTPFRDLQYIIHNINDPHLREHGEFKIEEKKSHFGAILFVSIVAFIALLMAF